MLRYLLDTNTCIAILKAPDPRLAGRFNRLAAQIATSAIVLAELRFGAENSRNVVSNLLAVENLVARLAVLDFGAEAAQHYGQIRHGLRKQTIGPLDTLIAAHARSAGLVVVTSNVREFARVPGLEVENWLA